MLCIFDLDDTLCHEGFDDIDGVYVFDDTVRVLQYLTDEGHTLAIASHNDRALELLHKNGLAHFFDHSLVQGFESVDKVVHIDAILHRLPTFSPGECVFFDDVSEHVEMACKRGMRGVVVCHVHGLSLEQVKVEVT
jgi:FMN phosphatase YigB (HAD superfamily)